MLAQRDEQSALQGSSRAEGLLIRVFVSYVREDALAANWIASELSALGAHVWLDTLRIRGGQTWRQEIASAVDDADIFVPLFSSNWIARENSVAQEELSYAQKRARTWLKKKVKIVPVRLDSCDLRAIDSKIRQPISSLHVVSFSGRSIWNSLRELADVLGYGSIRIDSAEPLALGLPSRLDITNGAIKIELTEPRQDQLSGLEKLIMRGEIFRDFDDRVRLQLVLRPPFTEAHEFDKQHGLDTVNTASDSHYLAIGDQSPTLFVQRYSCVLPKQSPAALRHMGLGPFEVDALIEIEMRLAIVASEKSVHGIVDSDLKVTGQQLALNYTHWSIVQAACRTP
jgi:hypothetical protein